MKKKLPTILLGATISLAMATFSANAFAQGAGGGGEVELVAPEQAHREDLVRPAVAREVEAWEAAAPEARVP